MNDVYGFQKHLQSMRRYCQEQQSKEGLDAFALDYWKHSEEVWKLAESAARCYLEFEEEDIIE